MDIATDKTPENKEEIQGHIDNIKDELGVDDPDHLDAVKIQAGIQIQEQQEEHRVAAIKLKNEQMNQQVESVSSDASHWMRANLPLQFAKIVKEHAYNGTVLLIPVTHAHVTLAMNAMCSVRHVLPQATRRIVFWALDPTANEALENIQTIARHSKLYVADFGIVYAPEETFSHHLETGGFADYYRLKSNGRIDVFFEVLDQLNLGLMYAEPDIVFLKDIWTDVIGNDGLGTEDTGTDPRDVLKYLPPDIVYSADPRLPYNYLENPFEEFARVPRISSGFFYARPTWRSLKLFKILRGFAEKEGGNAEWSLFQILNTPDYYDKLLITAKLPVCLPRFKGEHRWCPNEASDQEKDRYIKEGMIGKWARTWGASKFHQPIKGHDYIDDYTLRVRILDPLDYMTAVYANQNSTKPWHSQHTQRLKQRQAYFFHHNMHTKNKIKDLKQLGLWFIDDQGFCPLAL